MAARPLASSSASCSCSPSCSPSLPLSSCSCSSSPLLPPPLYRHLPHSPPIFLRWSSSLFTFGTSSPSSSLDPRRYRKAVARRSSRFRFLPPRADLGGQYDDNFADVDKHLLDYFTYKAVRTVLVQLYEMNPTEYSWFYNFVVEHKPQDSKLFLRALVKEKQDLCERVMVTRLHLYNKWIKKHDHGKMYRAISDQNLELLRERLVQTVKWADAEDADKI